MVNDINMAYESKHLRPLVSIVTATYNSARFIQETYASIASQTIKDWEWIITDDCSTDSTVHIIKSICMNDSRVSFTVNILKVGTVEIVVRRGALNEHTLFPEDMGAGEKFPICDEPVFLSRCLDCGLKMVFLPIELCIHPPVSSGMLISSSYTQSRGLCIRRVFGLKGIALLIPFALKMKRRNKNIIIMRFIFDLFKGFYAK